METRAAISFDVSEAEIRDNFRLLTQRPITRRTVSVGKSIARIAQQHVIEILRPNIINWPTGDYYLIKAEILDQLLQKTTAGHN